MDQQTIYHGAKVLVTGASGFIGEHLCRRLNTLGAKVTGIYNNNKPSGEYADWLQLDLTVLAAVRDAVTTIQPDYIFHLASYVVGRRELDAVLPTFENNLSSSIYLMTAAQEAGACKRFVLTNSVEEPDRGDPDAVPSSPYAASKFAVSAYARMFHALYGLPAVIARVFMVYGPDQKDRRKLVPYSILEALKGNAPNLSSGQRKIDWIYVDDVISGLLQLGHQPGLEGETIELGSGRAHSVREVVEEILEQVDPGLEGCFGAVADRALEQERLARVDESKNKADWQTTVSLKDGLAQTIAGTVNIQTAENTMDLQKELNIWVVVLGWDHPEDTIECLNSIAASEGVTLNLLYTDNGSCPETIDRISAEVPAANIVRHPENVGVPRGFNAGLGYALQQGADYIFMANNDTTVNPDCVAKLIEAGEAKPEAGILVPKIYYYNHPDVIWSAGARFRKLPPAIIMRKTPGPDDGRFDNDLDLDFTTLCTVLIRGDALRKSGLMEPNIVYYCEDYDLTLRIRLAGYSIDLVPEAGSRHKVERTTRDTPTNPNFWINYGRSESIFWRKFVDKKQGLLFSPIKRLYIEARCLYEGKWLGLSNFRKGWKQGATLALKPAPAWDEPNPDGAIVVREV